MKMSDFRVYYGEGQDVELGEEKVPFGVLFCFFVFPTMNYTYGRLHKRKKSISKSVRDRYTRLGYFRA